MSLETPDVRCNNLNQYNIIFQNKCVYLFSVCITPKYIELLKLKTIKMHMTCSNVVFGVHWGLENVLHNAFKVYLNMARRGVYLCYAIWYTLQLHYLAYCISIGRKISKSIYADIYIFQSICTISIMFAIIIYYITNL